MIWTKKGLTELLEQYSDDDVFAGELWTKLDARHEFAEVSAQAPYEGVSQEAIDKFDPDQFWNEFVDSFDHVFEHTISENSGELYHAIARRLKRSA